MDLFNGILLILKEENYNPKNPNIPKKKYKESKKTLKINNIL